MTERLDGRKIVDCTAGTASTNQKTEKVVQLAGFRIVTYNVLAQSKLKGPYYGYLKGSQVNWEERKRRLLAEICSFEADILLLQEVDYFDEFWQPELSKAGYDGVYEKRPRRHREGVATFFNRGKFQLFCSEVVRFNEVGQFLGEEKPSARLEQDNIGLILGLQPWEESDHPSAICVANAQLVAPKTDDLIDVQRKQVLMLIRKIEKMNADFQLPIVMGGSFNFLPQDDNYYMLLNGSYPKQLAPPGAWEERPEASPLSLSQILLSWTTPPESGDAPIKGYMVKRRVGGQGAFENGVYFPGSGNQVTVCGLSAGLTYEFIVAAVNAVGVGSYSQPSSPTMTMKNIKAPPTQRYLRNPKEPLHIKINSPRETLEDWLHWETKEEVLVQTPAYEDKTLNLDVNPCKSRPMGSRPERLVHTFDLDSAYRTYDEKYGEPSATLNSERFRGCVDYLFYSKNLFKPRKRLTLPSVCESDFNKSTMSTNSGKDLDPRRPTFVPDQLDIKPDVWDDQAKVTETDYNLGKEVVTDNLEFMGVWNQRQVENRSLKHAWLPNDDIPSDHAALLCDFEFVKNHLHSNWN